MVSGGRLKGALLKIGLSMEFFGEILAWPPNCSILKFFLYRKTNHKLHCTKKISFPLKIPILDVNKISRNLRICSHLLKKSLTKNFIFWCRLRASKPNWLLTKICAIKQCFDLLGWKHYSLFKIMAVSTMSVFNQMEIPLKTLLTL